MDPHRQRSPLELADNPIVFALGQVVISPVLQMGSYVPAIQERLRKAGFPGFAQHDGQTVQFGREVQVVADTRWVFTDRDRTTGVVLHPNFMVIEQTKYNSFEEFITRMQEVTEVVSSAVEVDFAERIGFRRVNLIEATADSMPLQEFVKEGLRGLRPEDLQVDSLEAQLEEHGVTPAGQIIVRLTRPSPGTGLPPDLMATSLVHREPQAQSDSALLDIDHYSVGRRDFNPLTLAESFWELHNFSDLAFRAAVTDQALSYWRGSE